MAKKGFIAAGALGIPIIALVTWTFLPHKTRNPAVIYATIVPNGDSTCKINFNPPDPADDKKYPYWPLLSKGNADYVIWQSQDRDMNTYSINFPNDTPFQKSQFTVAPGSTDKSGAAVDAGFLCGAFGYVCKYNYTVSGCSNSYSNNIKNAGGVQATPILTMGVHIS